MKNRALKSTCIVHCNVLAALNIGFIGRQLPRTVGEGGILEHCW